MLLENTRPVAAKKKFVIKGLKQTPQLPANFESGTWRDLAAAVAAVQHAAAVPTSLEELYQAVETLCVHKHAAALLERLRAACDAHIASIVADMAPHVAKSEDAFLPHMRACWDRHCEQMLLIRSIFLYLDRSFVVARDDAKERSIFDLGLQQFRRHLDAHPRVGEKVVSGVLLLVRRVRGHDAADRGLLLAMLRMLRDLHLYSTALLPPFLADTRALYRAEGNERAAASSPAEFLAHCEARLAEERALAAMYLDASTAAPLLAAVKAELLAPHLPALLATGLPALLEGEQLEDLARLYRLCGQVDMRPALCDAVKAWVLATGTRLVTDTSRDTGLIQSLLDMHSSMETVVSGAFAGDAAFSRAVRDAFERFINRRDNKPAELVAKFMDHNLRGGNKAARSEGSAEAKLDRALLLFRFIQGKDVFEAFYKKDFAKRLLLSKSASVDIEKSMLTKLKAECGAQYTSKLEGMFQDEQVSRDMAEAFRADEAAAKQMPEGIDATVRVLTSGFWPTYPIVPITLPPAIHQAQKAYNAHYVSRYSGRTLRWVPALEQCTLKARYPAGAKDLQVSMHQAAVLMLFNAAESLPYADIHAAVGLPEDETKRTLQSLALGKVRVLRKVPKGKEVEEGDVFEYVRDFTHALVRLKINQIQVQETHDEVKRTNEQVLQDRQHQMDAAIVRTMKARRQLSHQLLLGEVLPQLRFSCKGTDLKKRIESLIEREYMCRDGSNHELYNYVA